MRTAFVPALAVAVLLGAHGARAQDTPHPDLALVPADWSLVGGLDVRGLLASRLWTQVVAGDFGAWLALLKPQAQRESLAAHLRDELPRRFDALDRLSGIRVDRELSWLVLAVRSPGPLRTHAVIIASGTFDRAKVVEAWKARGPDTGTTVAERTSGTTRLWTLEAAGRPSLTLAVTASGPVMWGTTGDVEELLARAGAPRTRATPGVAPGTGLGLHADETMTREILASFLDADLATRAQARRLSLEWRFDGESELALELPGEAAARDAARAVEAKVREALASWAEADEVTAKLDVTPLFGGLTKVVSTLTVQARGRRLRIGAGPLMGVEVLGGVAVPLLARRLIPPAEQAALRDVVAVHAAEVEHRSLVAIYSEDFSGEGWGEITCLRAPRGCIEGAPETPLLDAALASLAEKDGYRRTLHTTPGARAREMKEWAYTATPTTGGLRSFCVDSSGVVRFDAGGATIAPVEGACPAALPAAYVP